MAGGRLPNLLVIGAPKAGTGSLFDYLGHHPEVCPADEKEVGFLNRFHPQRHSGPVPPLDEYRVHFAHCGGQRYALEAAASYCYGGRPIIEAAKQHLDDPRIVLSLRDPVARLWSAYTFQRELGNLIQFASFEEYLDALERRPQDGSDLVPGDHLHGLYIGRYAEYVPLWLDAFGDRMRIVFTERLNSDAGSVVADVFSWLGLDPAPARTLDLAPRNVTNHPRSVRAAHVAYSAKRVLERRGKVPTAVREPVRRLYQRVNTGSPPTRMAPETRRRVEDLYRASTSTTAEALRAHGYRDLPSWLSAPA